MPVRRELPSGPAYQKYIINKYIKKCVKLVINKNSKASYCWWEMPDSWTVVQTESFMRTALCWVVTQRVVVNPCRRFGTTYRPISSRPSWIVDR